MLRRMRLFVVLFILTILCREDISIGTAVFGLFLMLTGHRARAGLVIFLVSLVYFVLLRFVVMPAVGTWGFADHYRHLFPAGEENFRRHHPHHPHQPRVHLHHPAHGGEAALPAADPGAAGVLCLCAASIWR